MAAFGNYFIDSTTLALATAVFTDNALSNPAPDGFYSQGTVVREQVNGLLTAVQTCPSCTFPCGQGINTGGNQGIYDINFSAGNSTGPVIIYVQVTAIPDGIRILYNNTYYNELTTINFGYAAAQTASNYTYIGNTGSDCNIAATLNAGGYQNLSEFNWNGASFDTVGTTGVVTGAGTDVQLTNGNPGWATIYFPKTQQTPEDALIQIFGPCNQTGWDIEINCPVPLTGVPTSGLAPGPCLTENLPNTYYNIPNRGGFAGDPQINEFYVSDINGINKVISGTYVIEVSGVRKEIVVDINGVITSVTTC